MRNILSILDRYLAREILLNWLAVLLVLMLVVMSAEVARLLSMVVQGQISTALLLPLMLNSAVKNVVFLMPLSSLLAVLLAFGRLYKDSEMAAIMSAGCGAMDLYRPLLWLLIPASLILLVMTLFVVPQLNARNDILMEQQKNQQDLSSLMAGRFNPSSSSNAVFFIESHDEDSSKVDGVFFKQTDAGVDTIDIANSASNRIQEDGSRFLVMNDGKQYIGTAGEQDYRVISYSEYGIRMSDADRTELELDNSSMSSMDLYRSDRVSDQAELQWRFTIPVAMFIIVLIAVPLSHTQPRSGRYSKLAVAIVLYLLYSNLLSVSNKWVVNEKIPVWLGGWWVHVAGVILLFVLLKHYGYLGRAVSRRV